MTDSNTEQATYKVTAKRWNGGWELHIDDVGVTQSRTLNDAEAMVRDYISLATTVDPGAFIVEIAPETGSRDLDEQAREARLQVAAAESAQRAAAARSRSVARRLKSIGLSGREIAIVLRVSPQRVSQLLKKQSAA